MKAIFLDTNVILDLLMDRHPFYEDAAKLASLAEKSEITIAVSALSFANTHYIIKKKEGDFIAREKLKGLKILTDSIIELNELQIDKSLVSRIKDFEDALQLYSALEAKSDVLITRNEKDFAVAGLPVMSPHQFLKFR